jgi:nicotinate-nucleotide adenylyltransferase
VTGLFGGLFDPPHHGHVAIARKALAQLGLGELVVLVVADPGHRAAVAPAEARLRLAEVAFRCLPRTRVELDEHRFTVDLLRSGRFADPVFVVGADELAAFPTWMEHEEVLRLARLAVGTRPGVDRERLQAVLGGLARPDHVLFFEIEPVDASSTAIRARVARGEPIDEAVPADVARAIAELGLYQDG